MRKALPWIAGAVIFWWFFLRPRPAGGAPPPGFDFAGIDTVYNETILTVE